MTIFRREYASYFNSSVAWIVVPIFLLVFGTFFWFIPGFFIVNQASLRRFFDLAPIITAIFAPAMTMRLLAEERRSGTIELLATMPLRDEEIVVGKYLGALALMATAVALTLVYALTTSFLGELDWGPVVGGYVGLVLLSGAYLAIGTLTSSWTNNQVVALFLAVFINICLFLIDAAVALYLPGQLIPVAEFLSFSKHFQNISRGVIDLRDLVFYLSVIGICLFVAVHSLRMRRLA
jgi:ABC-2 type transport system permease protein